jgi:hypothetical protein
MSLRLLLLTKMIFGCVHKAKQSFLYSSVLLLYSMGKIFGQVPPLLPISRRRPPPPLLVSGRCPCSSLFLVTFTRLGKQWKEEAERERGRIGSKKWDSFEAYIVVCNVECY